MRTLAMFRIFRSGGPRAPTRRRPTDGSEGRVHPLNPGVRRPSRAKDGERAVADAMAFVGPI